MKFVHKLLTQYRELGTLCPKIRTKQTPIKLTPEQLEVLRLLALEQPDATLTKLQACLHEKTKVFNQYLNRRPHGASSPLPNL